MAAIRDPVLDGSPASREGIKCRQQLILSEDPVTDLTSSERHGVSCRRLKDSVDHDELE